ncbi:transmembrane protein 47-like [Littorina saxatilis]|uniref:Uncharacterized protein n=1 Tax=Littorina saxatilis TaxID=31220 RepID=A0AAN9AK35_9CAEN
MESGEVRVFRPFKLLAVIMSIIAFVLMIVSVAGPDWMEVSFHQGEAKSWGLWWDCFKVNGSFQMCVQTDWLFACGALVLIGLICMLVASILGCIGLCTHKRLLYVAAGAISIFSIVLQIICLIIYPVKFTEEVKDDKHNRAETQRFDLDWTYGVAWGAVCFMIGAAILFLIKVDETQEVTQQKDNTPPPYYLNYTRA